MKLLIDNLILSNLRPLTQYLIKKDIQLVIIFIRINVRPGKRKELTQTILSIVEKVRKESGCLRAEFYQDIDNEDEFLMVEEWATQQDADDHLRSDMFTVLMGAGCLMRRPPEIVIHTVSRSRELESERP